MRTDSRLARMLHVLLHLEQAKDPITSEQIGQMLATNPSLVRRTMGGLRKAGIVTSVKGHGGGWCLAKPLTQITLLDVYEALGSPGLFALGLSNVTSTCLLEQSANKAIDSALDHASAFFRAELTKQTVADLVLPHAQKVQELKDRQASGHKPV
ncbi:Rrf2 family transcriptional regulator [Pseudovibrio japonicus]|uniref:Rrf2 family transcriptional regulator n=1 Tax=Pseudovibrio japonicus TaxID=366534 RepID=A0ABQ3E065_9HYPH|nr:Rrf2 family transcriptional regulator [Pseudovibrio japonicus]